MAKSGVHQCATVQDTDTEYWSYGCACGEAIGGFVTQEYAEIAAKRHIRMAPRILPARIGRFVSDEERASRQRHPAGKGKS